MIISSVWRWVVNARSVTRLGDSLKFGQKLIWPNLLHSLAIFVKFSKPIIFLVKSLLGNFYRHLAIFFWSHWMQAVRHFKIISELSHAPERTRWDSFREEARTNRRIFGWDWRGEITEWSILDWTQGEKQLLRNF